MDILQEALAYSRRGWAVFPLRPKTKKPATKHGFKDASTDADAIRKWWTRNPDYNVAIATGAVSGLFVLDIDPRHGGDATWADLVEEYGPPPRTPTVRTGGGGTHYLFRHPGEFVASRQNALGPGVDVKGDGGYVVAAPSIHDETAKRYEWATPPEVCEPAALPSWIEEIVVQPDAEDTGHAEDSATSPPGDCSEPCVPETLGDCASVSLCLTVDEAIERTLPEGPGERNGRVFRFARALKTVPELAGADLRTLRPIAKRWHDLAHPRTSGKHPFDDTWADLVVAWKAVKYPLGTGPLREALARADAQQPPDCAADYGTTARRLTALCRELQRMHGHKPFFLAGRSAADVLGIGHKKAAKLLSMLCADEVLELTYAGHTGRASEYCYLGDAKNTHA